MSSPPCAPAPNQLLWTIDRLASDVDYTGDQHITGAYGMGAVPLGSRVQVIGGARRETTDFSIVPVNPILGLVEVVVTDENLNRYIKLVPDEEGQADIADARWLPALGIIVDLAPQMKLVPTGPGRSRGRPIASWRRSRPRNTWQATSSWATRTW